jgi:hypothetical protein
LPRTQHNRAPSRALLVALQRALSTWTQQAGSRNGPDDSCQPERHMWGAPSPSSSAPRRSRQDRRMRSDFEQPCRVVMLFTRRPDCEMIRLTPGLRQSSLRGDSKGRPSASFMLRSERRRAVLDGRGAGFGLVFRSLISRLQQALAVIRSLRSGGCSSRQVASEPVTKPLARGQAGALGHRPDRGKMKAVSSSRSTRRAASLFLGRCPRSPPTSSCLP